VNSAEQFIAVCSEKQQNAGLAQHSEDVGCYIGTNKVAEWLIPVHWYVVIHSAKLLAQSWVWLMPANLLLNSTWV